MAVISRKARKTTSSPLLEEYLIAKSRGEKHTGGKATDRTIQTYRKLLVRIEDLAHQPLHEMTPESIDTAIAVSKTQGLSQSYRNIMLTAGRGFFGWAIRTGKPVACQYNPFAGIRTSKRTSPKEAKRISEAQFGSIIRAIETIDAEQVHNAKLSGPKAANLPWVQDKARLPKKVLPVKLMFYGGLRISEAVSLKICNIDDTGIIVEGSRDSERYVPLPEWLIAELKHYVRYYSEDSEYVFTPTKTSRYKKGTPLQTSRVNGPFDEGVNRAGLPDWVKPHTLRHSYAFQAAERTQHPEIVQKLLGFENMERVLIYFEDEISSPYLESRSVWE